MRNVNVKKLLALSLATATFCSALTGCGDTAADPSNTAKQGTTNSDSGKKGSDNAGNSDAGAEKSGSITVMTYDRANIDSSEGTATDNRWVKWIKENCPVANVEFVAYAKQDAAQTMTANLSAGTAPDLLPNYESSLSFAQNELCLEITDEMLDKMPNYKMLLEAHPIMQKSSMIGGKRIYFCKFSNILPNHTVVIRKDWLDAVGKELPTTPEELYDIIYAFTYDDPDGNGKNDTWGINMTTDAQRVLSHMYGFGNPTKYAMNEKGELYYAWERIESWLDFSKKIIDNKCVNPDFITMKGDDDQADFLNGKIGIYCSGRFTNANRLSLWSQFTTNFPNATLETFALPESEHGAFTAYANGGASTVGFINSDLKGNEEKINAVLAYSDWLYSPEVSEYLQFGPDGTYMQKDEDGTYSVVDSSKNAKEFDYRDDYAIMKNELLEGGNKTVNPRANDWYNTYLSGSDASLYAFGDLYYKMVEIANDTSRIDPRKWLNDGLPQLPDSLAALNTVVDKAVNDGLKAALTNANESASDVIARLKADYEKAGGKEIDEYYAKYYKEAGDKALLADDFNNAKSAPVMTEAAKKNSKLGK